jgi:hypothetical protein
MDQCLATTSEREFIGHLRPGDILLFDSFLVTSALIKFADNSPVNHCAIFLGGEGHEFAHVTHHQEDEPAIQVEEISTRLSQHHDYSITALRHQNADPVDGAPRAIERVQALRSGPSAYAYLNLIALFVPAFLRSYRPNLRPDGFRALALERAESGFLKSMSFDDEGIDFTPPKAGLKTLTCSQFVYLCFARSQPELTLEISEPLVRYKTPEYRAHRGAEDEDSDFLGLEFHPGFGDDESTGGPEPVVRGDDHLGSKLAGAAKLLVSNLLWHNRSLRRDGSTAMPGQPVPELITPKDIWTSPSLVQTAVLLSPARLAGQ